MMHNYSCNYLFTAFQYKNKYSVLNFKLLKESKRVLALFKLHWKTDDSAKQTATKDSMDWANEKLAE